MKNFVFLENFRKIFDVFSVFFGISGDAEGFLHKIQSDLESLSTLSLDEVDSGCLEEATYRSSEESVLVEEVGGGA